MALDWQAESVRHAAEFYSDRAGYSLGSVPPGARLVVESASRSPRSVLWMAVFDDRCFVSTGHELVSQVEKALETVSSYSDLMGQDLCCRLFESCRERCQEPLGTYRGTKLVCCSADYVSIPEASIRKLTAADLPSAMHLYYPDIPPDDPEYAQEILGGGAAYGCFPVGELVSLAHTHHPGYMCDQIGDLSVEGTLGPNRNRGYGKAVVAATTGEVIRQGRTPVWGMFDDNVAAQGTAASVGFQVFCHVFEVRYR